MTLARNALLALSTNRWLRERATRTAFVRRSISTFMPGERLDDAMAAAQQQQVRGIGTILTKLGENLTRVDEAEEVTEHYLAVIDQAIGENQGYLLSPGYLLDDLTLTPSEQDTVAVAVLISAADSERLVGSASAPDPHIAVSRAILSALNRRLGKALATVS